MKKTLLALIFALVFILSFTLFVSAAETNETETATEGDIILGDVNGDGIVTNADVLAIFRYIYNSELYPLDVFLADVNSDGIASNADVLMIYRYIYNSELYPLPTVCNHSYDEWIVAIKPDCVNDGLMTRSCTKCGAVEENAIEANGHTKVFVAAKAPTCTKSGNTAGSYCSVCLVPLDGYTSIGALGHKLVSYGAKSHLCSEGWEAYKACSRCDYTTYEEIPAVHQFNSDNICSLCKYSATEGVVVTLEVFQNGTSSSKIINQGDEVTVQISINKNVGVAILSYIVDYDVNAFEYVSHTNDVLLGGKIGKNDKDGYLLFTRTNYQQTTGSTGVSFTITLRAKDSFCGVTNIEVALKQNNEYNCIDKNGNVVTFAGSYVDRQIQD